MREIPKEILDRCTFKPTGHGDPIEKIHKIVPVDPCPCGATLDDIRLVRIQKNCEPHPHWREYCHTCKLVSILDANVWQPAQVLNAEMRQKNLLKNRKG